MKTFFAKELMHHQSKIVDILDLINVMKLVMIFAIRNLLNVNITLYTKNLHRIAGNKDIVEIVPSARF